MQNTQQTIIGNLSNWALFKDNTVKNKCLKVT